MSSRPHSDMPVPDSDFPDPLDDAARARPGDTDELISRLADEAIDRMIAEDESAEKSPGGTESRRVKRVDAADAAVFRPPVEAIFSEPALQRLFEEGNAFVAPDLPRSDTKPLYRPAEPQEPDPETVAAAASLNVLLQPTVSSAPTPTQEAMPAAVAEPDAPLDSVTSTADRDAATVVVTPPAPAADVRALLADVPPAGVPVLLRPLEWLNWPFGQLPEGVRIALGQVGILTILNAAAVLAYVLLFRRHRD